MFRISTIYIALEPWFAWETSFLHLLYDIFPALCYSIVSYNLITFFIWHVVRKMRVIRNENSLVDKDISEGEDRWNRIIENNIFQNEWFNVIAAVFVLRRVRIFFVHVVLWVELVEHWNSVVSEFKCMDS